jgi:hypothetical protein
VSRCFTRAILGGVLLVPKNCEAQSVIKANKRMRPWREGKRNVKYHIKKFHMAAFAFHHHQRSPLLVVLFVCTPCMTLQDVIRAQHFHSTWWFKMIAVVVLIILPCVSFPRASFYCLFSREGRHNNLPLPMAIVSFFFG